MVMMKMGTTRYARKNFCDEMAPFVCSFRRRKMRKSALDASNAPVNIDRISPDRFGKVLDSWKDEMNTKGPPRARSRYPGIYPSNGNCLAMANRAAPMARQQLPMMPLTRGPYASRMVPTGSADTLVTTAAIVNIKFSLASNQ
jgi:hypothetical protein